MGWFSVFEFQDVEKAGGKKEKGTEAGRTWSGVLLTDPRRLEQRGRELSQNWGISGKMRTPDLGRTVGGGGRIRLALRLLRLMFGASGMMRFNFFEVSSLSSGRGRQKMENDARRTREGTGQEMDGRSQPRE